MLKIGKSLVLLAVMITIAHSMKGSCRASRRCCDGKDPDCLVQDFNFNEILDSRHHYDYQDYGEENVEPCYCDHGCLDLGDCCPDFKEYCGGE